MESVNVVDGRVEPITRLTVRRVETAEELKILLPSIIHNELLTKYVMKRFQDPDTLILRYGASCIVMTILEHDFFGKVGLITWGQNPDHADVRQIMWICGEWAKERGATQLVAFIGEEGPWDRLKAFQRLTKMRPYRMVVAKELE
jgi:hypothetical protein